jgi:hypothetical protein
MKHLPVVLASAPATHALVENVVFPLNLDPVVMNVKTTYGTLGDGVTLQGQSCLIRRRCAFAAKPFTSSVAWLRPTGIAGRTSGLKWQDQHKREHS